jgi:ferredoxin-thioredoxin reductase catalytic subunit
MTEKEKIFCPVCQVNFLLKESKEAGKKIVCPVCGAVLVMRQEGDQWRLNRPTDITLEEEIRQRMDNFAHLRGYHFNEMKEALVDGLLKKHQRFGDFYCPCRIDNVPENVCPCIYTRQGDVEKNGRCHCGLFWK